MQTHPVVTLNLFQGPFFRIGRRLAGGGGMLNQVQHDEEGISAASLIPVLANDIIAFALAVAVLAGNENRVPFAPASDMPLLR